MINNEKLQAIIAAYKIYFPKHWRDERFKWEAVKHFQDIWDINAVEFAVMFEEATLKTANLLASNNFYPRGMILDFAKADPGATRAMFVNLFDETQDLASRVDAFQEAAEMLRSKYGNGGWKNHYQNTNAISTYLWLRFPEKYYIYKYSECLAVAKELQSSFMPRKNASSACMLGGFGLYDEICAQLLKDKTLGKMLQNVLTKECYKDAELKTLTIDVGYYVSRFYAQQEALDWQPANYTPGLSVDDWVGLLNDKSVFTVPSLEIMKRMKDCGGIATCTQLAMKYGKEMNFYNSGSSALAKRVAAKTGCPIYKTGVESRKWWPILYLGKDADKNNPGSFIWKLRDELSDALDKVDLSQIVLYASTEEPAKEEIHGYWWLNANPKIWSFSAIAKGEKQSYTLFNENGRKRRVFQNYLDAKVGDKVICYESNPVKQIVAIARISQEQDGRNLYFEKVEGLTAPIDYLTLKGCPELSQMEFFLSPQGSLFKLTKDEFDFIMDIIRDANPSEIPSEPIETYNKKDFLAEVYMSEAQLDVLTTLLRNKKNIILQGAPGVGKTFTAKRLAYVMMGQKNDARIELIQFHQNYSYEDFVIGYKPQDDGFKLTKGLFYRFCQKAANHSERDYFFIIDEINRGNMSKIFGELLMLIEKDYRDTTATLSYNGISFSVPGNLFIIGMMNTADRGLAMIDYALRRRFSFFEMAPGFHTAGFRAYQKALQNKTFDVLIDRIKELNREIVADDSLGEGFQIGHSYFCGQSECTDKWFKMVVDYEIIPLLKEYWFDDKQKVERWSNVLRGVFYD